MPRLTPPSPSEMNDHQRRIHDAIASGPRGRVRGPVAIWLHRPAMAEHAQALGRYCRYESSLTPAQSEFAILVMALHWRSEFEWWAHKPLALQAGVSQSVVDSLRAGGPPAYDDDAQETIHAALRALHDTRRLPDTLYRRALAVLGRDGLVDLVALAGYYTLISMTINVFEIEPPAGEPRELAGDPAGAEHLATFASPS